MYIVFLKNLLEGGENMKKEWQKPELEVLDVNKTMLGSDGDRLDNDFTAGTGRDELTFS